MSLSCASATFCAGVEDGDISIYDGVSWSTPEPIDGDDLVGISCAPPHFCGAFDIGPDGKVTTSQSP